MAVFTTASVLGIESRGEFLGEHVARYRTVKTFNIEGFIDSLGNTEGVSEVQQTINNYVLSASSSDSIMEEISINGTVYGTGRIVSLDFPAGQSAIDNQVQVGQYSAQIEMYESGDLSDVFAGGSASAALNNSGLKFIQDISEEFTFNRSENDDYDYTHNVSINFISGVTGSAPGDAIDPFGSAYNLAQVLFDNRPSYGFDILGNLNYQYDSKGLAYYTETKDKINGNCSYSKQLTLYPSGLTNGDYSSKITNSFEVGQDGIGYVVEKGEIQGRDDNSQGNAFLNAAVGLQTELGQSYGRCSGIYDTYKNYIDDASTVYLYSGIVQQDIMSHPNTATREYSIKYTDDEAYRNQNYIIEREQTFTEKADNTATVSEQGTITHRRVAGGGTLYTPTESNVKNRVQPWYNKCKYPNAASSIKVTNSSLSLPKYGKTVSYSYTFSDSPEINLSAYTNLFNRRTVSINDSLGGAVGRKYLIPNRKGNTELFQGPLQTSVATRDVVVEYQLKREASTTWADYLATNKYLGAAKAAAIPLLYKVFADMPQVFALDKNEIYISDVKISIQSNRTLRVSMQVTYPMQRGAGQILASYQPT